METKKIKALSSFELSKIFGGYGGGGDSCDYPSTNCPSCHQGADSIDCTSEGASGGSTTDTE